MRKVGGTQNAKFTTIDAEGDIAMNEKTLNERYISAVRSKNKRGGAQWQRVKEVPTHESRSFESANAAPEYEAAEGFDATTLQRNQEIEAEVTGRVRKLMELAKQILTQQQYNVFILTMVKDPALTYREAGKVLGISFGRVRQHADTLRAKLERAYNDRT